MSDTSLSTINKNLQENSLAGWIECRCVHLPKLTFCSSLEKNLAAATGEGTIMAAGRLVWADQAGPLGRKEELHGDGVLSACLKPVTKT